MLKKYFQKVRYQKSNTHFSSPWVLDYTCKKIEWSVEPDSQKYPSFKAMPGCLNDLSILKMYFKLTMRELTLIQTCLNILLTYWKKVSCYIRPWIPRYSVFRCSSRRYSKSFKRFLPKITIRWPHKAGEDQKKVGSPGRWSGSSSKTCISFKSTKKHISFARKQWKYQVWIVICIRTISDTELLF